MLTTLKYILPILLITARADQLDDQVDIQQLNTLTGINYQGQMYSGYLQVADGTYFHYYFYPAYDNPVEKKVILWLNGGPGCSSLQGAVNENGPFVFKAGTDTFELNDHSWTNFANMLYIESPINVGFSYGPEQEQTDESTAVLNTEALVQFYLKFPEYLDRDLYIAGESYAGIYIPTLASKIIDYNLQPTNILVHKIKLVGLAIGNGCTDPTECSEQAEKFPRHAFQFYGRHGFVTDDLYQEFCTVQEECYNSDAPTCKSIADRFEQEINQNGEHLYNPYNVYGNCFMQTKADGAPIKQRKFDIRSPFFNKAGSNEEDEVPPCADAVGLLSWFRNAEFLQVTHIRAESAKWKVCNDKFGDSYKRDNRGSLYLYPKLLKAGIRVLKFSGDVDAIVPITGTLYWINNFQVEYELATIKQWRPWFVDVTDDRADVDKPQNAGNVWELDGLTFLSIKGAGHMVPLDKRAESTVFMKQFLSGQYFP